MTAGLYNATRASWMTYLRLLARRERRSAQRERKHDLHLENELLYGRLHTKLSDPASKIRGRDFGYLTTLYTREPVEKRLEDSEPISDKV